MHRICHNVNWLLHHPCLKKLDGLNIIFRIFALLITLNNRWFISSKSFILGQIILLVPIIISCISDQDLVKHCTKSKSKKEYFKYLPFSWLLIILLFVTVLGTFMGEHNIFDFAVTPVYIFLLIAFELFYLFVSCCYQSRVKYLLIH